MKNLVYPESEQLMILIITEELLTICHIQKRKLSDKTVENMLLFVVMVSTLVKSNVFKTNQQITFVLKLALTGSCDGR